MNCITGAASTCVASSIFSSQILTLVANAEKIIGNKFPDCWLSYQDEKFIGNNISIQQSTSFPASKVVSESIRSSSWKKTTQVRKLQLSHVRSIPDILQVSHSEWLIRPLPAQYLQYSSRDAYLISMLYAHFKEKGYINNHRLSAQSVHYVSIFQGARPVATDIFHRHSLLPLHILNYNDSAETRSCISCRRSLPQSAYSTQVWETPSKRQCWVCRAVSVKASMTTTR